MKQSWNEQNGASLVALRKWVREIGISDVTAWRWRRQGLINPVDICGKLYLTAEDIASFNQRAQRGEFAKGATGAATTTRSMTGKTTNKPTTTSTLS